MFSSIENLYAKFQAKENFLSLLSDLASFEVRVEGILLIQSS